MSQSRCRWSCASVQGPRLRQADAETEGGAERGRGGLVIRRGPNSECSHHQFGIRCRGAIRSATTTIRMVIMRVIIPYTPECYAAIGTALVRTIYNLKRRPVQGDRAGLRQHALERGMRRGWSLGSQK